MHSLLSQNDGNLIVDVQTSPWKVDTDVQEIVEHNKRVRMTKVTKSRRVIITKTETGEEIETVVEEEDDDNPEVCLSKCFNAVWQVDIYIYLYTCLFTDCGIILFTLLILNFVLSGYPSLLYLVTHVGFFLSRLVS